MLLAAMLLVVAACNGDDDSAADDGNKSGVTVTAGEANLVGDDGRSFSIVEVGLGADGYVVLSNFTESPASLNGLYLCQPPECVALPEVEVAAGESAVAAMGDGKGIEGEVATGLGLYLQPGDGEVGLHASEDVEDPEDIRAYIQWGSTPHDGTATAIEAGLWLDGSYVESAADATRIYRSESNEWVFETG